MELQLSDDNYDLLKSYYLIENFYFKSETNVLTSKSKDGSSHPPSIDQLFQTCLVLNNFLENGSFFSPNEYLDDLPTLHLNYLNVPILLSFLYTILPTQALAELRSKYLNLSKEYALHYLSRLEDYHFESASFPLYSDKRQLKISQFKAKNALLDEFKCFLGFSECYKIILDASNTEALRSAFIKKLEYFSMVANELIAAASLELEMIHSRSLENKSLEKPQQMPTKIPSSQRPLQPFILLPSSSNQKMKLQKEVFRPSHRLPTMTVDEYLRKEYQLGNIISAKHPNSDQQQQEKVIFRRTQGFLASFEAGDDSKFEKLILNKQLDRRGERLSEDDDDDEDNLEVDEYDNNHIMKVRAKDAYRDHHQRGSGNRYNRS